MQRNIAAPKPDPATAREFNRLRQLFKAKCPDVKFSCARFAADGHRELNMVDFREGNHGRNVPSA
jgi:hypothetical protein